MKYISLIFKAPFASFGCNSKLSYRETTFFPTKSSIFGLILAAMGKKGTRSEIKMLVENIVPEVYDFKEVQEYLHDYQTIGMNYDKNDWHGRKMIPANFGGACTCSNACIKKVYLENIKFGIILEIKNDELAVTISESLKHPIWNLFFGRKNCIPSAKIYQGSFDSNDEAMNCLKECLGSPTIYITEKKMNVADYDESMFINDIPLIFVDENGNKVKEYSSRRIYIKKLAE